MFVRQTNIIWLGFLTVEHALDMFESRMEQPVPPQSLNTPSHFRVSEKITYMLYMLYISYCCNRGSDLQCTFSIFLADLETDNIRVTQRSAILCQVPCTNVRQSTSVLNGMPDVRRFRRVE